VEDIMVQSGIVEEDTALPSPETDESAEAPEHRNPFFATFLGVIGAGAAMVYIGEVPYTFRGMGMYLGVNVIFYVLYLTIGPLTLIPAALLGVWCGFQARKINRGEKTVEAMKRWDYTLIAFTTVFFWWVLLDALYSRGLILPEEWRPGVVI
jgi:hypothetical protein